MFNSCCHENDDQIVGDNESEESNSKGVLLDYFVRAGTKKMDGSLESVEKPFNELEKIKLENLRIKHREEQLAYRENQREFLLKKVRFLKEDENTKNLAHHDITTLAKALKNKGQVSCDLLNAVMNALLDSKDNITAFLKVDGALQALLRLLSGQNEKFQLIAAQCICNLALGDEKQSLQVLKASESYLMVHLSGRNRYVMEACIIALGNFSNCSMKNLENIELLINQGFFPKIINVLNNGDPNIEAAAIYALSQLIYHGFNIIRPEDIESCLLAVLPIFQKRSFSVAFLMSVLSSCYCTHRHFISHNIHSEALKYLLISLKEEEKEAVYFLRILSNLINEESGEVGRKLIEDDSYFIRDCISCILKSDKNYLKKECLGMIGNFMNHPVEMLRLYGMEITKENFELIRVHMNSVSCCPDKMN